LKCEGGRKEQRWRWEAALDLYTSLVGSGASGRVAGGLTAAWPLREEFPDEATAVSCYGITDMNNTRVNLILIKSLSFIIALI
jgi:hypothetical protein